MSRSSLLEKLGLVSLTLVLVAAASYLFDKHPLNIPSAYGQIAGGPNSDIIAMPIGGDGLLIVDGSNKKMLLYEIKSLTTGLKLREVRSFDKTLEVSTQFFSAPLSAAEEVKALKEKKDK